MNCSTTCASTLCLSANHCFTSDHLCRDCLKAACQAAYNATKVRTDYIHYEGHDTHMCSLSLQWLLGFTECLTECLLCVGCFGCTWCLNFGKSSPGYVHAQHSADFVCCEGWTGGSCSSCSSCPGSCHPGVVELLVCHCAVRKARIRDYLATASPPSAEMIDETNEWDALYGRSCCS
jgi:hypothetical protein